MEDKNLYYQRVIAYRRKVLASPEDRPSQLSEHTKKCIQIAIKQTLSKK